MKKIQTVDAVGHILCHDMTQIIKDVTKDARFRKGHVVREEDIPVLLSMGKEHLYVWEKQEGMLHENEGARILCDLCKGENMEESPVKEGKIDLFAGCDGLFTVDVERLNRVNLIGEMMIATRGNRMPVRKGDKLAGTRVIPLVIAEQKMEEAKRAAGEMPLLSLKPFLPKRCGIVSTGSEVKKGLITDQFSPVVANKLGEYGAEVLGVVKSGDDPTEIAQAIRAFLAQGAEIVVCTGGMSVDPDDRTPAAIRQSGVQVVSYGAPVLPGAMFLLAYTDDARAVVGLPGCVMYSKRTIFDLVLPHLMTDDRLSAEQIARLGNGGLCLGCEICHYPICPFGRS